MLGYHNLRRVDLAPQQPQAQEGEVRASAPPGILAAAC